MGYVCLKTNHTKDPMSLEVINAYIFIRINDKEIVAKFNAKGVLLGRDNNYLYVYIGR